MTKIVTNLSGRRFTALPTDIIRHKALSHKSRNILCYILSHSSGAALTSKKMAEDAPDGRDAVLSGFNELRIAGFMELRKERGEGGEYQSYWSVSDTPTVEVARQGLRDLARTESGAKFLIRPKSRRILEGVFGERLAHELGVAALGTAPRSRSGSTGSGFSGSGESGSGVPGAGESGTKSSKSITSKEARGSSGSPPANGRSGKRGCEARRRPASRACKFSDLGVVIENDADRQVIGTLVDKHGKEAVRALAQVVAGGRGRAYPSMLKQAFEKQPDGPTPQAPGTRPASDPMLPSRRSWSGPTEAGLRHVADIGAALGLAARDTH